MPATNPEVWFSHLQRLRHRGDRAGEERQEVVRRGQVRGADARQLRLRELHRVGAAGLNPNVSAREPAGEVVRVHLDLLQAAAELELVVAGHVGSRC